MDTWLAGAWAANWGYRMDQCWALKASRALTKLCSSLMDAVRLFGTEETHGSQQFARMPSAAGRQSPETESCLVLHLAYLSLLARN